MLPAGGQPIPVPVGFTVDLALRRLRRSRRGRDGGGDRCGDRARGRRAPRPERGTAQPRGHRPERAERAALQDAAPDPADLRQPARVGTGTRPAPSGSGAGPPGGSLRERASEPPTSGGSDRPGGMLLGEVAAASADVAATSSRRAKVERSSAARRLRPEEVPVAVAYLSGELPRDRSASGGRRSGTCRRRTGAGRRWSSSRSNGAPPDRSDAGAGPRPRAGPRSRTCSRRATEQSRIPPRPPEGEIRQGALEGVMVEAVARAANVPLADVRRAAMLAGDLGADGRGRPRRRGAPPSRGSGSRSSRPVQPMLAQSAADVPTALGGSARPPSNGSSTAPGSRCTGSATRSACSPGTSPT